MDFRSRVYWFGKFLKGSYPSKDATEPCSFYDEFNHDFVAKAVDKILATAATKLTA